MGSTSNTCPVLPAAELSSFVFAEIVKSHARRGSPLTLTIIFPTLLRLSVDPQYSEVTPLLLTAPKNLW